MPVAQRLIDACEYFVILLGGRYGTLSPLGLSFPHREYIFAATRRKPVLALIHDQPLGLPDDAREATREGQVRRDDFARLLENKVLTYRWRETAELTELMGQVMPAMMREYPTPGWVRADRMASGDETRALREQLAALEKEREMLLGGGRSVARNLARGSDRVALAYSCDVFEGGDCKQAMTRRELNWDGIFACVAPLMLEPVVEPVLRKALEEHIAQQALRDVRAEFPKAHAVRNVTLTDQAFNQIKVQLRALGLIARATGPGAGVQWRLTAQGDATMSQLVAQRRPAR